MRGGTVVLLIIGRIVGITFLGIKYSVYYSVYYVAGFILFRIIKSEKYRNVYLIRELLGTVCIGVYFFLISRYNVFLMPDSSWYIIVRVVISLSGSMIVFMIIDGIKSMAGKIQKALIMAGNSSLELYAVHYFVVRFIQCKSFDINRIDGLFFCAIYTLIVVGFSYTIIFVLNQFKYTRFIFFGKKTYMK